MATVKKAKEIMGNNFFGPSEVQEHYGVTYTKKELEQLAEIPFSEAILEECRDTHVLVAGYHLSILDSRGKVERSPFYSREDTWYNGEDFAKEKVELRWYLVRKDAVPESFDKNYEEQRALIDKDTEEVPKACEVVHVAILYYLATGIRLFKDYYVRTDSIDSGGRRVYVGSLGFGGLSVRNYWAGNRNHYLGLSSTQKLS